MSQLEKCEDVLFGKPGFRFNSPFFFLNWCFGPFDSSIVLLFSSNFDLAEASGIPTASQNGTIDMGVYVANPDGAGPFTCTYSSDTSLDKFYPMEILHQVEGFKGINHFANNFVYPLSASFQRLVPSIFRLCFFITHRSRKRLTSFVPLFTSRSPSRTNRNSSCHGGQTKDVCVMKCTNPNGFGSCAAVKLPSNFGHSTSSSNLTAPNIISLPSTSGASPRVSFLFGYL